MKLQMKYNMHKSLTMNLDDYIYLFCLDSITKWQLTRTLKRYALNRSLNLLEENIYGSNGINILANGAKINLKKTSFLVIDQGDSIVHEFSGKKGTLLYKQIEHLRSSYSFQEKIDEINNMLLQLEVIIDKETLSKFKTVEAALVQMQLEDLLKKIVSFKYKEDGNYCPLEMMDVNELIPDFCELLSQRVIEDQQKTLIWLINPQNFLSVKACEYLLDELKELTKSELLKFVVISDQKFTDNYCYDDVERTKLIVEDIYELLPYNDLREIVSSHYPTDFNLTDEQLLASLYRILPLIASERVYIADKDMVLLKVLGQLLGLPVPKQISTSELSCLEQRFLTKG
ncbi:hypothetical protein FC54_GL001320 [Ligilactobacillus saerimneri DSM 16049]|nr:hypothetical protein FC54_GL001320 [Ligilactobacillus saerimneri DSM 16049]